MSKSNTIIEFFNRYTNKIEIEKVYGNAFIQFLYNNKFGQLLSPFFNSKFFSQAYGISQDTKKSAKKIPTFIQRFDINTDDYKKGSYSEKSIEDSYISFNEFFIRQFNDGLRNFPMSEKKMGAFSEARYYGHSKLSDDLKLPVKGSFIRAKDLISNEKWSSYFEEGPFLIARLCPVDYHRYHYPDNGVTLDSYSIHGQFHSVNPMALKLKQDILIKNERRVSILETENFGKIAYIEVGATCVGKIIQSHDESLKYKKGDEKGYFLFGGSTVIIIGEKGAWNPSSDILENTSKGIETYIHLGDEVASSSNAE